MSRRISLDKVIVVIAVLLMVMASLPALGAASSLYHVHGTIGARKYDYLEFTATAGTTIHISIYISGGSNDLDIELIAPDGRVLLPKKRYYNKFEYSFTATQTGTYRLLLDNTYSLLTDKNVDIALAKNPLPNTVTTTKYYTTTRYYTMTTTRTATSTTTLTTTQTVAEKHYITTTETLIKPSTTTIARTTTNTYTVTQVEKQGLADMMLPLTIVGGAALLIGIGLGKKSTKPEQTPA